MKDDDDSPREIGSTEGGTTFLLSNTREKNGKNIIYGKSQK